MANYFRIAGIVSFVGYLFGIVAPIFYAVNTKGFFEQPEFLFYICIYVFIIFIGPAFGLLFFSHANQLDAADYGNQPPAGQPVPETNQAPEGNNK